MEDFEVLDNNEQKINRSVPSKVNEQRQVIITYALITVLPNIRSLLLSYYPLFEKMCSNCNASTPALGKGNLDWIAISFLRGYMKSSLSHAYILDLISENIILNSLRLTEKNEVFHSFLPMSFVAFGEQDSIIDIFSYCCNIASVLDNIFDTSVLSQLSAILNTKLKQKVIMGDDTLLLPDMKYRVQHLFVPNKKSDGITLDMSNVLLKKKEGNVRVDAVRGHEGNNFVFSFTLNVIVHTSQKTLCYEMTLLTFDLIFKYLKIPKTISISNSPFHAHILDLADYCSLASVHRRGDKGYLIVGIFIALHVFFSHQTDIHVEITSLCKRYGIMRVHEVKKIALKTIALLSVDRYIEPSHVTFISPGLI